MNSVSYQVAHLNIDLPAFVKGVIAWQSCTFDASLRAPLVFPALDLRRGLFSILGKFSEHIHCSFFEAQGCCGGEVLANRGFITW